MAEESLIISFFYYSLPFLILIFSSMIIAIINLLKKYILAKFISYISLISALLISLFFISSNINVQILNGLLAIDRFSQFIWVAIILGGIISIAAMSEEIYKKEALSLLLISIAISFLAVSARDLIILFIALEASLFPVYALVFQLKKDLFSAEATIKFFIFGIIATLLFAYGIIILYGIIGSTTFFGISNYLNLTNINSELLTLGFFLVILSLAIKATLVPLHAWAIDTYQGAPTSISAFLSSSSKSVGIAVIVLLFIGPFSNIYNVVPEFRIIMAIFAFITMVLPNISALVQRNTKRLLAYSSVAHSGYMALIFVFPSYALSIFAYYLITYNIAKSVSFLIVNMITGEKSSSPYDLLRGIFKKNPLLAITFAIALLSLAGIPPFAGFMAKFLLFLNVAFAGNLGIFLALTGLVMSAVSVYYYAYVIRLGTYSPLSNINIVSRFDSDLIMLLSLISLILLTFLPSYFFLIKPLI